jgi:Flp pilus assembly pilin Flp
MCLEADMAKRVYQFWSEEEGQDLVEYTLLMAFVMFTIIGLASGFGSSIGGITNTSNSQISYANNMVQGS